RASGSDLHGERRDRASGVPHDDDVEAFGAAPDEVHDGARARGTEALDGRGASGLELAETGPHERRAVESRIESRGGEMEPRTGAALLRNAADERREPRRDAARVGLAENGAAAKRRARECRPGPREHDGGGAVRAG